VASEPLSPAHTRPEGAPAVHGALPAAAYAVLTPRTVRASVLTRGPWDPQHQHAGPPIAMVCRAIEAVAQDHGLTHIGRLTANPQRESALTLPDALDGHPLPQAPRPPADSQVRRMPFDPRLTGYADLVENRIASGAFFQGRCAAWFKLLRPLVEDETPSGYQRVAVAADSGNGISAVLDFTQFVFVNADLTINLLRRPIGEWICVDAQTLLAPNGCGLAESRLFDEGGLVGRATQSLAVRARG
jgi:hypothetical protein